MLDTYIKDTLVCLFENNYTQSSTPERLDEYGDLVNVNDYAVSNVREYLIGKNVYRGYTYSEEYDYIPALYTGQEKEENFLDVFNITSSPIYNMIEGRTLSDLYSKMDYPQGSIPFDEDVENGVNGIAGIDPNTIADKLWLLSCEEVVEIAGTSFFENTNSAVLWNSSYWLRSPSGSEQFVNAVSSNGFVDTQVTLSRYVRPAFKISIT